MDDVDDGRIGAADGGVPGEPAGAMAARARTRRRRTARRRRAGPRWVELSVAAAALVVSVASLLVARHQAVVMDRQLAAGVWPLVQTFFSNLDAEGRPDVVKFSLVNAGVGPLRVRSVRVAYGGRPVADARNLLHACCAGPDTAQARPIRRSYLAGRVVRAGEQIDFLTVPRDPGRRPDALFDALDRAAPTVAVRVCYCSVLDECWVAPPFNAEPEPVRSCAAEEHAPQYR